MTPKKLATSIAAASMVGLIGLAYAQTDPSLQTADGATATSQTSDAQKFTGAPPSASPDASMGNTQRQDGRASSDSDMSNMSADTSNSDAAAAQAALNDQNTATAPADSTTTVTPPLESTTAPSAAPTDAPSHPAVDNTPPRTIDTSTSNYGSTPSASDSSTMGSEPVAEPAPRADRG